MASAEINTGNNNSILTSIAPWLSVSDGVKAVAFYKSAFAAKEAYHLESPDGAIVSKLLVDGAAFWLSGETPGQETNLAVPMQDGPVRMILTVADPDALFAQALKAGASAIFPVGEEHGGRLGRLVDPFGHHWEIGKPLTD
jgi:PhnB protein